MSLIEKIIDAWEDPNNEDKSIIIESEDFRCRVWYSNENDIILFSEGSYGYSSIEQAAEDIAEYIQDQSFSSDDFEVVID